MESDSSYLCLENIGTLSSILLICGIIFWEILNNSVYIITNCGKGKHYPFEYTYILLFISKLVKSIQKYYQIASVGVQYILDSRRKRRRDRVSCAKVELPHNNLAKGDHISHEQEYNTGHGIPAISHEVCRKIRRQPRQSEIQQEPVVHLLLEAALGWKCGIPCLSVQAASQPSKPAYGSRTETHPGHAPQKSNPGHD